MKASDSSTGHIIALYDLQGNLVGHLRRANVVDLHTRSMPDHGDGPSVSRALLMRSFSAAVPTAPMTTSLPIT